MGKIDAITAAIEELSEAERAELRAWLDELEERLFDERIERDAKAGKLDKFAQEAEDAYRRGLTLPFKRPS
jgi:ribosomal protein L29